MFQSFSVASPRSEYSLAIARKGSWVIDVANHAGPFLSSRAGKIRVGPSTVL